MAARHWNSSHEAKLLFSCWMAKEMRIDTDRLWSDKVFRPYGRTALGLQEMITSQLAIQQGS